MAQYINKDALVAEINNCIDRCTIKKQSCPVNTQVEAICNNKIYAYKEILSFIDTLASLQEEPAPKIFEDMLNAKTPAESLGISAEEHDKIIDLCLYGKEPEMVDIDDLPKEEPVSKVWHDVNEKPIQEKPLFIVLSFKNYKDCRNKYKVGVYGCRGNNHPTWVIDSCYSDSFILKWAYIDDIINL